MSAGWKVTTHDLRPPVRVGEPIWDGTTPFTLPYTKLDTGPNECAAGWNFCEHAHQALQIGGLWPDGRPSRLWLVDSGLGQVVAVNDKRRSASLTILREATDVEVAEAIRELSRPFGAHAQVMVMEQLAWRRALGRPLHDPELVQIGLRAALEQRGLDWELKQYESARAAWAARAALVVLFASRMGWTKDPEFLLTIGIQDAYASGLEIALPTKKNTLGWAMPEEVRGPLGGGR